MSMYSERASYIIRIRKIKRKQLDRKSFQSIYQFRIVKLFLYPQYKYLRISSIQIAIILRPQAGWNSGSWENNDNFARETSAARRGVASRPNRRGQRSIKLKSGPALRARSVALNYYNARRSAYLRGQWKVHRNVATFVLSASARPPLARSHSAQRCSLAYISYILLLLSHFPRLDTVTLARGLTAVVSPWPLLMSAACQKKRAKGPVARREKDSGHRVSPAHNVLRDIHPR